VNTFDLARALDKGACEWCSTTKALVFHYEPALRPSTCPEARQVEGGFVLAGFEASV
jgi:hypothetical protein